MASAPSLQVGQWMVGIKRLIQEAEGPLSPIGSPISLMDATTAPATAVEEEPAHINCNHKETDCTHKDSSDETPTIVQQSEPAAETSSPSEPDDS